MQNEIIFMQCGIKQINVASDIVKITLNSHYYIHSNQYNKNTFLFIIIMHYNKHTAGHSYSETLPHQYFCYSSKFEWQHIFIILCGNSDYPSKTSVVTTFTMRSLYINSIFIHKIMIEYFYS
jgi:hypothetical protein